ncbi:MAG: MFS transporter [Hyphomonadaceae bacterium]
MSAEAAAGAGARRTPAGAAWWTVLVLILLYCMSFIDRLVLSLLAPLMSDVLQASDTEIGVLLGAGFGIVYGLIGLPLAHMVDKHNRVRLVVGGVLLWSAGTIASAFASSYMEMLLLRTAVAIGEAVLSPAAVSLIADMFPREKRAAPTTAYTSVATYMGAGAFVVGGFALDLGQRFTGAAGLEPWRLALIFVGAPGVVLAFLMLLTVREPARGDEPHIESFQSVAQAFGYVRREARLYGCLFIGAAMNATISFAASAWAPTVLVRAHGLAPAEAGYFYGVVGMAASILGVIAWPVVSKLWTAQGRKDALPLVIALPVTVNWLAVAFMNLTPVSAHFLIAAGVSGFFGVTTAVLVPLLVQNVTPSRMRARIMALYLMANNLIGFAVGPALAAFIGESFFTGAGAIGQGVATVAFVAGPIATLAYLVMRKPYARALDEAQAREAQGAGAA